MNTFDLNDMSRGWFVGDFLPTAYKTSACEVAVKKYNKGDKEEKHYHKVATEITLIFSGSVIMFDKNFKAGTVIVIEPNEATSFEALEDTVTVVVKIPGAKDDKYLS
ncbi:MAG: hypothetical protein ACE365_02160 [Gammaproteobacteria bacterium]